MLGIIYTYFYIVMYCHFVIKYLFYKNNKILWVSGCIAFKSENLMSYTFLGTKNCAFAQLFLKSRDQLIYFVVRVKRLSSRTSIYTYIISLYLKTVRKPDGHTY